MLPFLMRHASAEPPNSDWRIYGFCLMPDYSLVIHQVSEYTFTWTSLDGSACIYTRPVTMTPPQRPDIAPGDTTLFTKPDLLSVWNYVIEDIESELGLLITSPIICNQRSYGAAPSLYGIIREAITEIRQPDSTYYSINECDAAIAQCAKQVMDRLPKEQYENLVEACRKQSISLSPGIRRDGR